MTIPKFFELTGPTLRALVDGKAHSKHEIRDRIAAQFKVSKGEQEDRIPSGPLRWANRFDWTLTHLRFALLIDRPSKGVVQITKRGLDLLAENHARLDQKILRRFAEYVEATSPAEKDASTPALASKETTSADDELTDPEQDLERSIAALDAKLAPTFLTG